ncbi:MULTISPECIES: hypothetical protein [unclassified Variovorax]|jgi:hypothetical protein|uniref:hypothetical protein n=1 Tax=unclassified Variovorax TaxID=663243 RepID=UPI001160CB91|nr:MULTISPECIES: hypothetical protein [unclassified Variovorax]
MDLISWTAAAYILLLPSSYQLVDQKVEHTPFPGTSVATVETHCTWTDERGRIVAFSWWKPMPAYPGGQMVPEMQMSGWWANEPAVFVQTKVFDGVEQRVSVAFQKNPRLDADARIFATSLDVAELQRLLNAATVRDLTSDQAARAGCEALGPT